MPLSQVRHPARRQTVPAGTSGARRTLARRLWATSGLAALALVAACSGTVPALGSSVATARQAGDQLFYSLSARFTNVLRTPKFAAARGKLARGALAPSRVWSDTSVWTATEGHDARVLTLEGRVAGNRYIFNAVAGARAPDRIAESRHVIRLSRLADADWEWSTHVEQAVGAMRANDAADLVSALFIGAESCDERQIRADYRSAFPRATTALGRLLSLDSMHTARDAEGATQIRMSVSLHPERLERAGFPAYARYVRKYVRPSRYRIVVADAHGTRWLDARAEDGVLTVRARARGGRLVALEGLPRPMPDSLQLHVDFMTHIMLFDVGVSKLRAELTSIRTAGERGWAMRFPHEPEWHLPPVVGRVVKSPLRRSFADGGSSLVLAVRDGAPGAQSLIVRDSRIAVRESTILRWIGSLGMSAMGDFVGDTELEENRFNAELFAALQADIRAFAMLPGLR